MELRRKCLLQTKREEQNEHDPYSIALLLPGTETVVGHIPREISRLCYYFMQHNGNLSAKVTTVQKRRSPIEQGGLEIPIVVTALIRDDQKMNIFKDFISKDTVYSSPTQDDDDNVSCSSSSISDASDDDPPVQSNDESESAVVVKRRRRVVMILESDSE